jgi:putative flippase GtrA
MNKEVVRAIKFALISASAGIVEIGLFTILTELTELPYWPRYLVALIASVLWNFTINRRYTFKSTKNVPRAMAMVFAFYLVFTPATTILGNYLADTLHWNDYLVTGINMALNLTLEYLYDTFVVYKGDMDNNDIAAKEAEREKKASEEAE